MTTDMLLKAALVAHIAGGTIGLIAGAIAMVARKGGPLHVAAGRWFFVSMMVMAVLATILAIAKPERLSTVAGMLAGYLVLTSWLAARQRGGTRSISGYATPFIGLACIAACVHGVVVAAGPSGPIEGFPPVACYVFGSVATLAVLLDLNALVRGQLSNRQRIARHLWRMCVAYFLAATSLFLGQQDDVFWFMQGSPILFAPSILTLLFMLWWIVRTRFASGPRDQSPA